MREHYHGIPLSPRDIESRRAELERIELLKGRPDRQTVIGADDILNLRIALETSRSLEEFIERT